MRMGMIEAAEEIQLLLPENQAEPAHSGRFSLWLGVGFLLIAGAGWWLGNSANQA
jgi:hypothetical protein